MYPGTFALTAPDRPAVIMGEGEVVTYRQLDERSNQFAHFLLGAGYGPGDVIAVFMENNARYHEVCWGARRIGLYFVTISSHLTADEISYILNDSAAQVLVSSGALAPVAGKLTPQAAPHVRHRLMIGDVSPGWQSYDEVVGSYPTSRVAHEEEGDLLQYSSGTTGRPKGIKRPLSHAAISADADGAVPFLRAIGFGDGDVYLSPAPLYHTAPIFWSSAVHRLGGTVVVMEKFDAARALELIAEYRVTHSLFVPTMFVRMLKLPGDPCAGGRCQQPADRYPRRSALPGRDQAADDRLVGAADLGVLLLFRGCRCHVHHGAGLAGASRARWGGRCSAPLTSSTRAGRSCRRSRPGRSGSTAA